jgi:uncharacterized phage-like protein YoqJ
MKMFKIAFTGHRPDKLGNPDAVRASIRHYLTHQLSCRTEKLVVLSGGALGVDTIAAEVSIELGIPYYLILPFPINIFTARWPASARSHLIALGHSAVRTYFIQRAFSTAGYPARNRMLVDQADAVCALYNGTPGGTKNIIDYAREQGKALIIIRV